MQILAIFTNHVEIRRDKLTVDKCFDVLFNWESSPNLCHIPRAKLFPFSLDRKLTRNTFTSKYDKIYINLDTTWPVIGCKKCGGNSDWMKVWCLQAWTLFQKPKLHCLLKQMNCFISLFLNICIKKMLCQSCDQQKISVKRGVVGNHLWEYFAKHWNIWTVNPNNKIILICQEARMDKHWIVYT
jgi:hypothetical protein